MTNEEWLEAKGFREVSQRKDALYTSEVYLTLGEDSLWREWHTPEVSLYLSLTAPNPKWVAYCSEEVLDSVGPSIGLTVGLTTEGNTPAEAVALLQANVRQYREDLHRRATLFDDYSGRLARYTP